MLYFAQNLIQKQLHDVERLKFVILLCSPLLHRTLYFRPAKKKQNWNNYPCHPKGEGKDDSKLIGKETGERGLSTEYILIYCTTYCTRYVLIS